MGQTVTLVCESFGGNPLASIVWFKNNKRIDHSYTTSGITVFWSSLSASALLVPLFYDLYKHYDNSLFLLRLNWERQLLKHKTLGTRSKNTYMFLAQPEDNNAVYRCEAHNIMLKHPLTAEITLSVQCKSINPISICELKTGL